MNEELIKDFKSTVSAHIERCGADNDNDYHIDRICEKFRIATSLVSAEARKQAIQAVIDWLQGDIGSADKRSAGLPSLKAIEGVVLQTVINALKEYQALKEGGKEVE